MIEIVRQIPGPLFLLLFAVLAAIGIYLARLWSDRDGSTDYPLPDPDRFDPLSIAALRGGRNAVIRTAVFSLWKRGIVDIKKVEVKESSRKGEDTEIVPLPSDQKPAGPIEREILQFLQPGFLNVPKRPEDLFQETALGSKIEAELQPILRELEEAHLAPTETDVSRRWLAAVTVGTAIAVLGVTKIYLGMRGGHPWGVLLVMLGVSLAVLGGVVLGQRPTRLGRRYLKGLEGHFAWLKDSIQQGAFPMGIEAALPIAIFGIGALSSGALDETFKEAFSKGAGNGGCGGGCGACGGGCGGCGCGGCG